MFQQDVKDGFVFTVFVPIDDVRFFTLKMIVNERFVDSHDIVFCYRIHPFFFDESF